MVLKNTFSRLTIVIFVFFLVNFSWGLETTVTVDPSDKVVEELSTSFTLDIVVNNVNNLHGASITVTWDNAIIHYESVSQGNFLKGGGTVFFSANTSPPTEPNSVTVDQAILGPYAVSGSGVLFSVNFTSLQFGTCPITINSIDLRDINNNVVDATVVSGQVQVVTPVPVELVSFTAKVVTAEAGKGEMVELRWQTVSEINNYGFEIERTNDVNPKIWQRLGFVNGCGTSNSLNQYRFVDNTVTPFGTYFYRLKQIDTDGSNEYSPEIKLTFQKPLAYKLQQNYPNPFNPVTVIAFDLPQQNNVRLVLVDVLGHVIKIIAKDSYQAGHHELVLNAADLAAGIYFYRIEAGGFMDVKKLLVTK